MSFALTLSRAQLGLEAPLVQVEAHLGSGLPVFSIVGLPAPVVRESRERVRAALLSSGFSFPAGRITVNLAPVELSKQGGRFDLPIALALLIASGQVIAPKPPFECYGELGLAGELKPVGGLFLAALHAHAAQHALIVPSGNTPEVRLSGHAAAYAAGHLRAAAERMRAIGAPARSAGGIEIAGRIETALPSGEPEPADDAPSLADIVGHAQAKRALIVAAAGGHGLLMVGPPGSGKSMLAARLAQLLPPLTVAEALEVASIASVAGQRLDAQRWAHRPFRAPHHTASAHAIVGGGPQIRPGEISLAHHGVLFLDELPEFDRRVLEALREPLENGTITIARAAARLELPARFQLVAAMNPCPCGYLGDPVQACQCRPARIVQYRARLSGPLLDRIDIRIEVPRIAGFEFTRASANGPHEARRAAREAAAHVQTARLFRLQRSGCLAARLTAAQLQDCCRLPCASERLLERSAERLALSGRGIHRLLALGRTIADLAGSEQIEPAHLLEAMSLRRPLAGGTAPAQPLQALQRLGS